MAVKSNWINPWALLRTLPGAESAPSVVAVTVTTVALAQSFRDVKELPQEHTASRQQLMHSVPSLGAF